MRRRLIRTDGAIVDIDGKKTMAELQALIGASTALDSVNLRHLGNPLQVMIVDDTGHRDGRSVNRDATRLYHANCVPGTTHQIRGDVAIVLDEDFA